MITGVKKLGRTTRQYRGLAFSYLPNTRRLMKVWVAVRENGEYTHRKFCTIGEAVAFIDDAISKGAYVKDDRNELVIGRVLV